MKKAILLSLLLTAFITTSCKEEQLSQEQEANQLEALRLNIEAMAASVRCEAPFEWTFTAIGSKACGGPVAFISYSSKIDTALFLQKVKEYTTQQNQFNERWGLLSDCSVPSQPTGIYCDKGVPVFSY